MTPMELAEIEARANAATPGPWEVGVLRRECDHPTTNQFTEERSVFPPLGESGPVALAAEGEHENGAFIAHARTDVPALIAEVKRLREEIAAARADHAAAEAHLAAIVSRWEAADHDSQSIADLHVPGLRAEIEEARDGREGEWWKR